MTRESGNCVPMSPMPSRISPHRRWATVSVAALLFNVPAVADAAVCWWVPNHDKATDNQFTFVTTLPLSNHTCTSRPGPTVNLTNDAVEIYSRSVTSGLNAEFT